MMRSISAILLASAALLASAPALACSPAPGYRVPTNLELAGAADAIVIGRVIGEVAPAEGANGSAGLPAITVHPLVALKGLLPGQDFPLHQMGVGTIEPSAPLEFKDAHTESMAGACIRRTFARGATVLFFLDRERGEWAPAGGVASRWAEDVLDETSPWAELVAFYVRVAALPISQQVAVLEAERDALAIRTDDPVSQAMSADIARQLAGPNPPLVPPLPPAEQEQLDDVQRGIDALGKD